MQTDCKDEANILMDNVLSTDAPCTYELDLCGWQTFTNMSINGNNVTRTWKIITYAGYSLKGMYLVDGFTRHSAITRASQAFPGVRGKLVVEFDN